jgi:hypothetical protein
MSIFGVLFWYLVLCYVRILEGTRAYKGTYYLEGGCPFLILQSYADNFRLIGLPVIWSLPTGKVSDKGVCLQNYHLEVSDKDISILVCFMCARFLYGWVYQLNDENGRRLIADHVQRIK